MKLKMLLVVARVDVIVAAVILVSHILLILKVIVRRNAVVEDTAIHISTVHMEVAGEQDTDVD
jgi:hypothetical protein